MNVKGYRDIVQDAMDAVKSLEEPLRSIAFKEVLRNLLRGPAREVERKDEGKTEGRDVVNGGDGFLQSRGIQTLPQLVNMLQPDSHILKTRLTAFSLRELSGTMVFQAEDIKKGYKDALMKPSTNISHVIRVNKKRGFFMDMEDETRVQGYSITDEGIKDVTKRIEDALVRMSETNGR